MMTPGAEPEVLTAMEHAATLRAMILGAVTAAITETVATYSSTYPEQPWQLDGRPGAARLGDCVDPVLDDVLEMVLLRPVDGMLAAFPSRFVLAP
jgi:hypothetical protein